MFFEIKQWIGSVIRVLVSRWSVVGWCSGNFLSKASLLTHVTSLSPISYEFHLVLKCYPGLTKLRELTTLPADAGSTW